MARLPGLSVIRSPVAGYGLITTRARKKGSVITNVEGVLWRAGEKRDDTYSLILEPGVFFDMVDQTRWVNHSCEPNVVVEAGITASGNGWAQLQALRDLRPGEELFYDYGFPPELKLRCRCGTKSCTGWIVERPPAARPLETASRNRSALRTSRPSQTRKR